MRSLTLGTATILILFTLLPKSHQQDLPEPQEGETCVLYQACVRPEGQDPDTTPCPDPGTTTVPVIEYSKPKKLVSDAAKTAFSIACPFMDVDGDLCCNDDQAEILEYNFRASDAVFYDDCPVCSANMKMLWCQYTCNPTKTNFISATGYEYYPATQTPKYVLTTFRVDPDYACGLFHSCEKESFIAEAALTSSIAFLDFLGLNGKDQGHSVISFEFSTDPDNTLNQVVHDCNESFEPDHVMEGYPEIYPCECTYCDLSCPVPDVDGAISFFDGANWWIVVFVYVALVIFSIVLGMFRRYCSKKVEEDEQKKRDSDAKHSQDGKKNKSSLKGINETLDKTANSGQESRLLNKSQ